ncbi:MAG: hypothetical protein J7M05_12335 [Anaerolineae bacterium]|nr:hypothetical protein [Anaerolineae bacterium]
MGLILLAFFFVFALVGGIRPLVRRHTLDVTLLDSSSLGVSEAVSRGLSTWLMDGIGQRLYRAVSALVGMVSLLRMFGLWTLPPLQRGVEKRFSLAGTPEEAWARLRRALATVGQGLGPYPGEGVRWAPSLRMGLSRFLPGMFYLGILFLLLAVALSPLCGWQSAIYPLSLGEIYSLEREGISLRLEEIALFPRSDGGIGRFVSQLAVFEGGHLARRLKLRLDHRALYRGLAFYQLGFGPAVRVEAWEGEKALSLQQIPGEEGPKPIVHLRFSGRQERFVAIPQKDLVLRLAYYDEGEGQLGRKGLQVQVIRSSNGQVVKESFISQQSQMVVDGLTLRFAFEYYILLRAKREPLLLLGVLGGFLLLVGLLGFVFWPPRSLWVTGRARGAGTECILLLPEEEEGAPWLECVLSMLGG